MSQHSEHYVYALGYYHGRKDGIAYDENMQLSEHEKTQYLKGYQRGVEDYIDLDPCQDGYMGKDEVDLVLK